MKKKSSSSSQSYKSPNKKQSNSPNKKQSNKTSSKGQTGSAPKRPNYQTMVTEALTALDTRKGSSRAKIF